MEYNATSHWCYLRSNKKLHAAIVYRKKERGLKMVDIAKLSNIPVCRISNYFNKRKNPINQFQLLTLARVLGIEINTEINMV